MLLLILAIAAIIGVIVSVSKSIKFLKLEDTQASRKWAFVAVFIVIGYFIVSFIYTKILVSSAKSIVGILGISNKKRVLKENETRSSGLPFSNYDLIVNTVMSKPVNRTLRKVNNVTIYETSDPDHAADGKPTMSIAGKEIAFSDDIELTSDNPDFGNIVPKPLLYTFKKGVVYKTNVVAPTDVPLGLSIKLSDLDNVYFYMSYSDGGLLDYKKILD